MINLILFGPPGSGKGTQAVKLIKKYNLVHISTGDLLRQEIEDKTSLGLEAQSLMNKGELAPDDIVIGMISSKLDTNLNTKGFIFDGFPRTLAQADALDNLLSQKNYTIAQVLSLQVSQKELIRRLLNRGKTSNRLDDRNESIIQNRIEEYFNKTFPVSDYYDQQNKLSNIAGEGSIDEIFGLLVSAVDKTL